LGLGGKGDWEERKVGICMVGWRSEVMCRIEK